MTLSLIYKGFNYVDFYNQEYSNNSLPAVAATGANSVALTPDWGIDVAQSSIYAGGETTDTTNLGTAITEANTNGMTAFVRPLIDFLYDQQSTNGPINYNPGDYYVPPAGSNSVNLANLPTGEPDANGGTIPTTANGTVGGANTTGYRGFLNPADINVPIFFGSPTTPGSYDYMIVSEAKAAASAGATLFSVGTELNSLADNAAYTTDWDTLIADVRAAAPSLKLTFSANWATASQVTFWDKLDYVGIDGYVPLSNTVPATSAKNPSLASLEAGWNTVSSVTIAYSGGTTVSTTLGGLSAIDAFDQLAQKSIDKQFIFTELGYQNDTGAAADPTGGSQTYVTDPTLQAELYTAFFDAWGAAQQTANADGGKVDGIPYSLVGAYIWDWTPDQSDDYWSLGSANQSAALAAVDAGFAACLCRGTRILTEKGEVAVEDLAIGDRVMTLSGEAKPVRWIGRRSYGGRFVTGNRDVLPIRVAPGALADGVPARELWLSPEHALYLDDALVPARCLVNRESIVQIEEADEVEYFHIELAEHDVIFADGAPAESFVDDDSRNLFHNAAEFHALYPEAASRVPASYCAPRVEEGVALEALRRRLLGRARRLDADGRALPAELHGYLDLVQGGLISGWARDPASPVTAVALVVLANGAEIGRVVADHYRGDLAQAGIGDGHHGFELIVPGGLAAGVRHEIEVRHATDWSLLPGSPCVLEADFDRQPPQQSAAASLPLGALRGNLDTCERTRILGWAQDSADPERRVGLLIKVDDRVIGRVLANRFRGDLAAAGIGDGRHAFELTIPNTLSALEAHEIRVEREADGAELPGSPVSLPAATGFDTAIEENVAGILASLAPGAGEDRALAFLTEQTDRLLARRAARHGGHAERESHRLFRRRWGRQAERGPELLPELLKGPQLRALVVDSTVPGETRDAGSIPILSHVRALRALGYAVSFAAADDMGNAAALARLAAAEGIATCGGPHYSCLEDVLCRQEGTFDLVYLHRAANADRYIPLVRRYCPKARILYSVAALDHLRFARQAQVERRPELLGHSRYLAAAETLAARRADIVITPSPVEAELLRRAVGFGKVHVVPFAVAPRRPRRPFAERHGVAILGAFGHAPNPDAVHYLVRDILPRVWARDPTLGCKIVGQGWHAGRLNRLDPRIEMIGGVADLDDVFDTVRLTVAPLRFGAGITGEVLDSLAAGLPCVMTPIAAEGLALTGALPQLVADNPAGLAERILHFHADRPANEQTGVDGARMVSGEFSDERVAAALRETLSGHPSASLKNDGRVFDARSCEPGLSVA